MQCVHHSFSESVFAIPTEVVKQTKRIMQTFHEADDAGAMNVLDSNYYCGKGSFQQDQEKAMELWKKAAELGFCRAHFQLDMHFEKGEDWKKEEAMAGHKLARYNLGYIDF